MPERIEGLTRIEAEISGCGWAPRTYATDPPRLTEATIWDWGFRVEAERPVYVVAMLECGPVLRHSRGCWNSSSTRFDLRMMFRPYDLKMMFRRDEPRDEVVVSFYRSELSVMNPELKCDPRPQVVLHVADGTTLTSGELVDAATIPAEEGDEPIHARLLLIATEDTEARRMVRWRLRRSFWDALPRRLLFLRYGRESGTMYVGME